MTCVDKKIDSNVVGLCYAEEECLGVLPSNTPGDEAAGVWFPLDPNEYSDFGGEIKTVARNPINASRQRRKGVVTDIDASGGFTQDLTQSNLLRLMQGFFFADAHEKPTTHKISGTATVVLDDYGAGNDIELTSGGSEFLVGHVLKTSGHGMSANNQDEILITAIVSNTLTTDATFVIETVDDNCKVEAVGYEFGTGVAGLTVSGATVKLTRSGGDFEDLNLNVGEWIYIGGDASSDKFVGGTNVPGYARIVEIASDELTLDQCTWTPATDTGTGKTIRIYFGRFLRNEKNLNLIKRRTYQLERTLGNDADDVQSEYLVGAIPNEFKMMIKSADKITCDLSFVALRNELRTGLDQRKDGNRDAVIATEDAFNTSSDVVQTRLFIHDANANTPSALFAYVTDASIDIKNNANGLKAVGSVGSFDVNIGDFEVGGSIEAYFATVEAVQAVKDNADVSYNIIVARENAGFVYDVPLLSLGGGRITVKKDEPVMIPLTPIGSENAWEYTLAATYFSYLPDSAMPSS